MRDNANGRAGGRTGLGDSVRGERGADVEVEAHGLHRQRGHQVAETQLVQACTPHDSTHPTPTPTQREATQKRETRVKKLKEQPFQSRPVPYRPAAPRS